MFHLNKNEAGGLVVALASELCPDDSEPEENLDWDPENHSDYDDDESDIRDVVLAPEGTFRLHMSVCVVLYIKMCCDVCGELCDGIFVLYCIVFCCRCISRVCKSFSA